MRLPVAIAVALLGTLASAMPLGLRTAAWGVARRSFVIAESYTAESDGSFSLDLSKLVLSASTPKVTVSGLPSGVKYDSKTMTISGKAKKPGAYTVKISVTNKSAKKAVTKTFTLVVPNFSCAALPNLKPASDAYGVACVGVAFDSSHVDCTPAKGWTVKASGLPSGLKWDAKKGVITGVPKKAGTSVTAL